MLKRLLLTLALLAAPVLAQTGANTIVSFDGQYLYYNDNSGAVKRVAVTPISFQGGIGGSTFFQVAGANKFQLSANSFGDSAGGGSSWNPSTGVIEATSLATNLGRQFFMTTAPTITGAGCGGSGATIVASAGTAAFKIGVGATPGSACTITMPAATTGWNCHADDITTQSASVFIQKQTGAESTTSVVITNFNTSATATAFTASDVLKVSCAAD